MREIVRRVYTIVDRATEMAVAIMLAIMVINVALNVITRYVFFYPIIWTEEFARYIMIWFAFLGMGIALRDHGHVAIIALKQVFSERGRKAVDLLIDIAILAFLILLCYLSLRYMNTLKDQTSAAMGISMQIPYFSVTAGSFLMVLQQIKRTIQTATRGNS